MPGRLEAALHVGLELAHERGMGELIREHRRDAECDRRRDVLALERLQRFDQGEIAVQRSLAQPYAAVRPAAVVQDVRKVTVQRENEIHRGRGGGGWGRLSDGRSSLVHFCSWTVSAACARPFLRWPSPADPHGRGRPCPPSSLKTHDAGPTRYSRACRAEVAW